MSLGLLKKLGMLPTARQKDSIRAARTRLIKKGLLQWEGKKLRLTEAGEKKLRYLRLKDYKMRSPKSGMRGGGFLYLIYQKKEKDCEKKFATRSLLWVLCACKTVFGFILTTVKI